MKKNNAGVLIVETLVAVAIMGLLIIAVFPSINLLFKRSRQSQTEAHASQILQEGMEVAYNVLSDTTIWDSYNENKKYKPDIDTTATPKKWKLSEVDPYETVDSTYKRWITFKCTDSTNTNIVLCVGNDNFKRLETIVNWTENGTNKSVSANVLYVKKYD